MMLFGIILLALDIGGFFWLKWLTALPLNPNFGSFWWTIIIAVIIAAVAIWLIIEGATDGNGGGVGIGAVVVSSLLVLGVVGTTFFNSNLFHATDRYNFANSMVHEISGEDVFPPIDMHQLPLYDEIEAYKNSETLLGKYPGLGSRFEIKQGDFTSQVYNGELVYVAPLQPTSMWRWDKEEGSPGFFIVNRNTGKTEFVEKTSYYTQDAPFGSKVERVLRAYDGTSGFTEITTQLDNDGNLKYVTTTYTKQGLGGQKVATGVLVMDAYDGKIERYALDELPDWLNRVYPMSFFSDYLEYYGSYQHGYLNSVFKKVDVNKATQGYGILYNEGQCYYYTGWTSVGRDEAANGIIRMNARTGEITLYLSYGISEAKATGVANGRMQEAGYTGGYPLLVQVGGAETYFTKMRDSSSNIVGYGFVNFKDYTKVGVAEDLLDAQALYLKALATSNSAGILDDSALEEHVAPVKDCKTLVIDGNTFVYFKLEDKTNIFSMDAKLNPEILFISTGDNVKVTYIPTSENIINVIDVTVNGVKITDTEASESTENVIEPIPPEIPEAKPENTTE